MPMEQNSGSEKAGHELQVLPLSAQETGNGVILDLENLTFHKLLPFTNYCPLQAEFFDFTLLM